MSGSNLELHLSPEDRAALAKEIIEHLKPFLAPEHQPMFWSEAKTAEWLGISRQTLSRLRLSGVITPERESPTGYGAGTRQALVELMSNASEWARARSAGQKLYKALEDDKSAS